MKEGWQERLDAGRIMSALVAGGALAPVVDQASPPEGRRLALDYFY